LNETLSTELIPGVIVDSL